MVYYSPAALDRTFAALADPTRRAMLARLGERPTMTAGELAQPFAVSLPAVLKHIRVLSEAGLVQRRKAGRVVQCRLVWAPLRDAAQWLESYEKFWSERLDALAAFVEEDAKCPTEQSPASRSGDTSERRSRRSSRPGPKAKR